MAVEHRKMDPFIGPRPFTRDPTDIKRFFGREDESEEILTLIFGHPLVLVYAQSGAGKTSLFNAKVAPSLEQNGFEVLPLVRVGGSIIPVTIQSENAPIGAIQPSSQTVPFNIYLLNTLQSLLPESSPEQLIGKSLSASLKQYFPMKSNLRGKPLPQVIIFDQFEEFLSLYPDRWQDEQVTFLKQISQALAENSLLRMVFVIREDYLAQLDPFESILPEKLRPRFRVERLQRDAALLAIKGPLLSTDENIDEELIKKIVKDLLKIRIETIDDELREVEGQYVEPIQLQVVCQRIWSNAPSPQSKTDQSIQHSDVDEALAEFYDEAVAEVVKRTGIDERVIRDWCERRLITPSGTRSIVHREHEFTRGISNKVIDILEEKYLIRVEWRAGGRWYELTHDRLINPIKQSNKLWRDAVQKKRRKLTRIRISVILSVVVGLIVGLYVYSVLYPSHPFATPAYLQPILISQIKVPVAMYPDSVAVNPNNDTVYVGDLNNNTISVIDARNNTPLRNIPVGVAPHALAVNPNTNTTYIADSRVNYITFINNTGIYYRGIGHPSYAIAVNPDTNMIYAVGGDKYNLTTAINGTTYEMVDIPTPRPVAIAINPYTNRIYVGDNGSNIVSVINGSDNRVLGTIPVGRGPYAIAVNSNTNTVYVANSEDNDISVINGATLGVLGNITVMHYPFSIAINPNTNTIYVANFLDNSTSLISGAMNTLVKNFWVGEGPEAIDVDPDTNKIFVANSLENDVSIINGTDLMHFHAAPSAELNERGKIKT